uniref:uncharacterized protein LOC109969520 n=1 Tax=Monopterus albus TaxID=43700 RepID=UPI0009B33002|nr:uncharacterized protein LOC109969520 [Monopterus albus]
MSVTVSMSLVWLKLVTILCLSCTSLKAREGSNVVWKDYGSSITIQCRSHQTNLACLSVKKGLLSEEEIFYQMGRSPPIISDKIKDRVQLNGAFPNVDILIKNLTVEDTGPYWCSYVEMGGKSSDLLNVKSKGSVLLVVKEKPTPTTDPSKTCNSSNNNLVLVSVVISAAVLAGIIMVTLVWVIIKTRSLRTAVKPRRVTTNDVYEDMRGTLRR